MADVFVFSNRAVTALQDSVDQFETTFDFGVDDLDRFPTLSGGAKFPIILSDREDVFEICYVSALTAGGEATVERAREGSSAQSWSAGTFVEHCMTAGSFLAAARLVPKGEWSAATNYLPGDVVEYIGISYIASASSLNQVPSAGSTYWQTLYVPPGVSSTALNWSGDWNSGVTYAIGAYVKYQGKLYVAVAAGLNHVPSDASYWYPLGTPPDAVTYDNVLTAAGTNNYTVAPSPAPTALFDGMELSIIFTNTNSAAATLTVGALAPAPLRPKVGVEFAAGELPAGTLLEFVYRLGTAEFVGKSAAVFEKGLADLGTALDARLDTIEAFVKYVPVGGIIDWPGATAPTAWLICQGQELPRATYTALDAILGTTFGAYTNGSGGAGTTHLRLPDLRGRATAGLDAGAGRLTGATLGAAQGSQVHQLNITEIPSHDHGGTTATTTNGSHSHTYNRVTSVGDSSRPSGAGPNTVTSVSTGNDSTTSNGDHNHSLTVPAQGGGQSHNNVQPTMALNKIIFTGVA